MLKVLKNLKESFGAVVLIVILLCVQATTDLALPSYTSKIVNIGIQQGGIENSYPEVILKSQMDNILKFTNDDEKILANYDLIKESEDDQGENSQSKDEQNKKEQIIKKYPEAQNQDVYVVKKLTKIQKEELNNLISKPLVAMEAIQIPENISKEELSLMASLSQDIDMLQTDYELQDNGEYKLKEVSDIEKGKLKNNLFMGILVKQIISNKEMSENLQAKLQANSKANSEANVKANAKTNLNANLEASAEANSRTNLGANAGVNEKSNATAEENVELSSATLQSTNNSEATGVNLAQLILTMPQEQKQAFIAQIENNLPETANKLLSKISDSVMNQAAVKGVKEEYKFLGADTDKIQSNYIWLAGLQMLGIAAITMASAIIVMLLSSRVAAKLSKTLREKVFKKVLSFSTEEFNNFSTASLITRSTNDIQQIQNLMTMLFRVLVYAPIIAIGGFIRVLLGHDTSMAWIIALAVSCIVVLVLTLMIFAMPKFKKMQKLVDRLNLVAREILTGTPVIRAFNTEKREEERFDKANIDLMKNQIFVNRAMTIMMPAMMLIMNAITVLIVWVGADKINAGTLQVGDMMAFMQYTMQIVIAFLMISMISIMLPRASVSANRINEVLETEPKIKNKAVTKKFDPDKKGLVEFKNVSFHYPDADEEVISDINFTAYPGKTTAIIGSTGSGKSTVVNLIPRFYDVTGGEICIDGINIKDADQKELRSKIGFIPQKGMLFSGTIESNIKYGNKNISDEQMKKAAEIAQAEEFINSKGKGYEEPIAQGGSNVSGGQKQRLSIARALAIDPEILVFDDSFSALDMKTDQKLREELSKKTKGKTNIIVAQRISTIMTADQIIVLDEGKIVGKGTHSELLKSCEVYKQIALSQLSKEELENGRK